MALLERFIRGSDNQITVTLTENDAAITGAWTGLDVVFGGVQLTRSGDGDGITLSTSTGVLTINPGDLTAAEQTAIDALVAGRQYRCEITVRSATNDDGTVFGREVPLYFAISDLPSGTVPV